MYFGGCPPLGLSKGPAVHLPRQREISSWTLVPWVQFWLPKQLKLCDRLIVGVILTSGVSPLATTRHFHPRSPSVRDQKVFDNHSPQMKSVDHHHLGALFVPCCPCHCRWASHPAVAPIARLTHQRFCSAPAARKCSKIVAFVAKWQKKRPETDSDNRTA